MKKAFIFILMFISLVNISAQVNSIFMPFVSRIKAESAKSSIKLSWKDTDDLKGNCVIYRGTAEISPETIDDAVKIARVPQGVEFYEDYPPYTQTNYYYAIFMEDENSLVQYIYIPFRNITSKAALITEKTKDKTPALITELKAWAGTDSVELSFKCSKPSAELFIYRNTEPIEDKDDIIKANLIATLQGSAFSFTDYPVPGIAYYYGVIDSSLIKTGSYLFKAGENITVVPVEIAIASTERVGLPEIPNSRPKPLPYLSVTRGYQSGRHLSASIIEKTPERMEISKKTAESIEAIIDSLPLEKEAGLAPQILKQDKNPEEGSEQSILLDILNGDFINGNYETALVKLLEFQRIRRSTEIEASVHFYLGQIYYFLGEYNNSFSEFLFAEDNFYIETRPWINDLFKKLR